VNRIEVKEGRAVAVVTEKGLRVEAEVIINNANPSDTLLKFVGREHLPSDYIQRLESGKPATSNLVVYLGLDTDLRNEGWHYHERFVPQGYEIDAAYEAALRGDFANAGMASTYYNLADPGYAPEGGSILNLFSLTDWNSDNQWGTGDTLEKYSDNPQYNEIKTAAANILLDRMEEFIPQPVLAHQVHRNRHAPHQLALQPQRRRLHLWHRANCGQYPYQPPAQPPREQFVFDWLVDFCRRDEHRDDFGA